MRTLLFKNLGLKIVAIVFSIFLWLFATHRGLVEVVLDVPLEFKNIPPGLVLVNNNIKKVSISIKGQERLIRNVGPTDIRAFIDLSDAKKGEDIYLISKVNVKVPRWMTVTNIDPSSVKVVLEEVVSKIVRVRPVIVGNPEEGFYLKSITVDPQTVVIEGKSSDVKRISSIETEPFDITGLRKSYSQYLRINTTDQNIKTKVEEVMVSVVIVKRGR